jgi:hypothetical protein
MPMTGPSCRSLPARRTPPQGQGQRRPIAPRRTRRSSSEACSRATSTRSACRASRCPAHIAHANAKRSAVRSAVAHVFARQKHRACSSRTIGIAPRAHHNRDGEPRLQLPAPRMARGERRACIARKSGNQRRFSPKTQANQSDMASLHADRANNNSPYAVIRSEDAGSFLRQVLQDRALGQVTWGGG